MNDLSANTRNYSTDHTLENGENSAGRDQKLNPADKWHNENVIITSKLRCDAIMALSLCVL